MSKRKNKREISPLDPEFAIDWEEDGSSEVAPLEPEFVAGDEVYTEEMEDSEVPEAEP